MATRPPARVATATAHQVVASTDAKSPVSKANLPDTCGKCHSNPALAAKYMFAVALPVEAYKQSVHGRAILAGNLKAASCNDCHGVHDILPASDPKSRIWKQNVASTCAQCHQNVFDVYKESIHGKAVAAGVMDAATCTDCHGEHRILAPGNPESPVSLANVSQVTCSRCHANIQLMARFNVPDSRVPTYQDSYHGMASSAGQQTVANCASCHGVHNIFRSQRSALDREQGQHWQDLRQVPSRRWTALHHRPGAYACPHPPPAVARSISSRLSTCWPFHSFSAS